MSKCDITCILLQCKCVELLKDSYNLQNYVHVLLFYVMWGRTGVSAWLKPQTKPNNTHLLLVLMLGDVFYCNCIKYLWYVIENTFVPKLFECLDFIWFKFWYAGSTNPFTYVIIKKQSRPSFKFYFCTMNLFCNFSTGNRWGPLPDSLFWNRRFAIVIL